MTGPMDHRSLVAIQVWNAITALPEGTTTVPFVFDQLGIAYPTPESSEIYTRLIMIGQISHELQERKAKQTNPQSQDLLAGTADDDEE